MFQLGVMWVRIFFFGGGGHNLLQASSKVAGKHENVGTANELYTKYCEILFEDVSEKFNKSDF